MKAWLVFLVLIISTTVAAVDLAVAGPPAPPKKGSKPITPNFSFDDPCSSSGGPYPGCDYKRRHVSRLTPATVVAPNSSAGAVILLIDK
ncbi:hypothetical protein L484_026383 [Morus notabilis]|uniref:Uncharacterized protein n=1 Tax=Morus notabilis TaxID=981085 RepID=W9QY98_9ROSA|nr:hypothetical protein L484_026383 [Morus notabilis]